MIGFAKVQTPDRNMNQLQDNIGSALTPIINNPITSGNLITNITMTANTEVSINHGLNRLQQGWLLTYIGGPANVWNTQPFNTTTLVLEASADTVISIYCF